MFVQSAPFGHVPQGERFYSIDGRRKSPGIPTWSCLIAGRMVHAQNGWLFPL